MTSLPYQLKSGIRVINESPWPWKCRRFGKCLRGLSSSDLDAVETKNAPKHLPHCKLACQEKYETDFDDSTAACKYLKPNKLFIIGSKVPMATLCLFA